MRQNPNQNPRQSGQQRQPPQQQPTQRPPTQQPPQQQPPQGQPPQSGPPRSPQGQPSQSPRGRSQGGRSPPQQGGQPPQQPPQRMETQPQGMAPAGTGMQQGMTSQQAHPQPGMQSGTRHSQQMGGTSHLQSVSLDDIIQEDVVTADPDTPLPTITSQMKKEDVGAVVITEDNKPRGIVTDRKVALSLEEMPDLPERTGEDVMTDKIVTAEDQLSVYEALQRLSDENVRRLPITDENDTLVGIVTLDDIMVLLGKELKDSTEIIKQQSPRL